MKIDTNSNYNPHFNGLLNLKSNAFKKHMTSVCTETANILNQNYNDIVVLTKGAGKKQINFLDRLVRLYNAQNYYKNQNIENSQIVNTIYKNVKNPTKIHLEIINHFQDSLENLNTIFSLTGNNKKKLNFVKDVKKDIEQINELYDPQIIQKLLESKNSKFYINNPNKIKSYLILNKHKTDAVQELDKMIENKTFNYKDYDKKLEINNIIQDVAAEENSKFNNETFFENYTPQRVKFLKSMKDNFIALNKKINNNESNEVNNMYISTNNKNLKLRIQLLDYFANNHSFSHKNSGRDNFLKELNTLFNTIDAGDSHTKKYLKKLTSSPNHLFDDPQKITEILTNVSSKKLNIFSDNSKNIIRRFSGKERIKVLQEHINEPFYDIENFKKDHELGIKYGYIKMPNIFKRALTHTKNVFNIIRDTLTRNTEPIKLKVTEISIEDPKVIKSKPIEEVKTISKNIPESILTNKEERPIIVKEIKREEALKKITSNIKKLQRKQNLTRDLISFINKKLGAKTYETQRENFVKNATKMRYEMLPEIFASIADTRKTDRALGKHRINSSNKDALKLYLKINGNNKKFVNYLLKKRNVDGSRMFEVKDIISILDKAEQQIKKQRQNNPEYRARDVRKYYNHLLESKIEQYGKVTRQKKTKTK